jgi:hypothetical protein
MFDVYSLKMEVTCVWTDSNVVLSGGDDGKLLLWSQNEQGKDSSLKEMKSKEKTKFSPY